MCQIIIIFEKSQFSKNDFNLQYFNQNVLLQLNLLPRFYYDHLSSICVLESYVLKFLVFFFTNFAVLDIVGKINFLKNKSIRI
jgi:hypothetical protein